MSDVATSQEKKNDRLPEPGYPGAETPDDSNSIIHYQN